MQKSSGSGMSEAITDLRVIGIAAIAQSIKTLDKLTGAHTGDESAVVKAFELVNKMRETLERRYPDLFGKS